MPAASYAAETTASSVTCVFPPPPRNFGVGFFRLKQIIVTFLDTLQLIFKANDLSIVTQFQIFHIELDFNDVSIFRLCACQSNFQGMIEFQFLKLLSGILLSLFSFRLPAIGSRFDTFHIQLLETFNCFSGFFDLASQVFNGSAGRLRGQLS